jgi:hypothetical protein
MSKPEVGIPAKEAKGAPPRRHHLVPQFYLRGFAGAKDRLASGTAILPWITDHLLDRFSFLTIRVVRLACRGQRR